MNFKNQPIKQQKVDDNQSLAFPNAGNNVANQQAYYQNMQDDEIDLAELWRAIWAGKFIIILVSALFAGASIFYALSQPNTYKASALLAPASSERGGGLAGLAGQFGGLASLAGINLGGGGDKTALSLEIMKSRSFLENFIIKHDLLVPLMASNSWDINSNQLIYNEEIYNSQTKQWLREVKLPKKPEPSLWESYIEFSKLLSVSQDQTSGLVTIEIEFYSPDLAKQWLTWLIEDINSFIKEQDQIEAQNSIDYLTQKLDEITVSNMETVFYQLIEEQSKNMMLTQVKAEYVLKTIDPPQVPEEKAGPKRALIVVLGTMLGGILSVLIVLVRYFTKTKVAKN